MSKDKIGALIILLFSIVYGFMSFQIVLLPFQAAEAFTARTLPFGLMSLGIVFSLILIILPQKAQKPAKQSPTPQAEKLDWKRGFYLTLTMLAYGLSVRSLGFLFSTSVFLIAGFMILGERRPLVIFFTAIPIVVFFWVMMTQFLGIYINPFPEFLKRP